MGEISLSDIAALLGNRNDNGFGGDNGALWLIIILVLFGGWGRGWGNNGNGGGAGSAGGNELYPWLAQQQNVSDGFRDQSLMTSINGIQQSLCSGFNQTQVGMLQGFNALQAQQAQCCCDNQLAMANQTAALLAEHCSDRQALNEGVRDIIANDTANTQKIIDKLCDQELQAAQRENANLRQQLAMADLAASQQAQNAFITQGFANEVDALYNRLNNCPVPSMPVYGRTPIFTCQSQNTGCGCGLA
jgi:hypothetical protein